MLSITLKKHHSQLLQATTTFSQANHHVSRRRSALLSVQPCAPHSTGCHAEASVQMPPEPPQDEAGDLSVQHHPPRSRTRAERAHRRVSRPGSVRTVQVLHHRRIAAKSHPNRPGTGTDLQQRTATTQSYARVGLW
uniref:(northern house mosquito) hypothetical protein n=1 Tax=Culex pipiens TaxID=7175 RepID=A0A8D8G8Z7_CULPI